jgi:hypothetical protein
MTSKLIFNLFLSIVLFLMVGCGDGTLTGSVKTSHFVTQSISSPLKINEILCANANTNYDPDFKEFSDWIELYNDSDKTINLEGYSLSDSKKNIQKWKFPSGTTIEPFGYLLVWADGKNQNLQALHTNFKLSGSGESVTLSNPGGLILDRIEYPYQEGDISCAMENGQIVYLNPTPKRKNSKSYKLPKRATPPTFSIKGGLYKGSQILELSTNPNSKIYYTLDGTTPTINSKLYENPITIDKTTVVRAIALQEGKFVSRPKTYTYLIDENITLPVVSLSIDEKYLNDSKIGIYKNFKEDWMRAGNIEYIKDGMSQFSVGVGIGIHGGFSRRFPIKSFSLKLKTKYGVKSISYPLFAQKKGIVNIKSFMLRNSGNDWNVSLIRDPLSHTLYSKIDKNYLSYEPTVTFINGNYFGILNLRELANDDFIKNNYKIDNKLNIYADHYGTTALLKGNKTALNTLIEDINNGTVNFDELKNRIDIDEFINYLALNVYIYNYDWLENNTRFWIANEPNAKFHWILHDTDFSFEAKDPFHNLDPKSNIFEFINSTKTNPTKTIYKELLKSEEFKNRFLSKLFTLLNTTFLAQNVDATITKIQNRIQPQINRHLNKWFKDGSFTYDMWLENIDKIKEFAKNRRENLIKELKDEFNLSDFVHLKIKKPQHATLYIDNIKVESDFNGEYFRGAKVTLKIVPFENHTFLGWSNGKSDERIELTLSEDENIEANFFE